MVDQLCQPPVLGTLTVSLMSFAFWLSTSWPVAAAEATRYCTVYQPLVAGLTE